MIAQQIDFNNSPKNRFFSFKKKKFVENLTTKLSFLVAIKNSCTHSQFEKNIVFFVKLFSTLSKLYHSN
jgi:hypothetical protein